LPHEYEWEYACRGGLGNRRPYHFGHALNGDKANCNGNVPYGTDTKGEYLARTTQVGTYSAEARHPWWLCDMHGNVSKWCNNEYSINYRVIRGGAFASYARNCRGAHRYYDLPRGRLHNLGFRVCFRPD
ncbi:MAG: formylglycine-generating enzyme family protein, partial [Fimbriiglobus sp.]